MIPFETRFSAFGTRVQKARTGNPRLAQLLGSRQRLAAHPAHLGPAQQLRLEVAQEGGLPQRGQVIGPAAALRNSSSSEATPNSSRIPPTFLRLHRHPRTRDGTVRASPRGSYQSIGQARAGGLTASQRKLDRNLVDSRNPAGDNGENSRRKLQNVVTDSIAKKNVEAAKTTLDGAHLRVADAHRVLRAAH